MTSTYLTYTLDSRSMSSTLARVSAQTATKKQAEYYNAHIGKVKTVDDLMGDYQLYSYAMKAYGLEDFTYAKGFMKKVFTSDLSDPASFANKLNDPRYKQIAAAFNFGASTKPTAQTDATETTMFGTAATKTTDASLGLYQQSFATEEALAAKETSYFDANIGTVKNVDDLLGNKRLKEYVLKAYGLDPTLVTNTFLKSMLTSDLSDPNSFINQNGSAIGKTITAQFNFNADGTIKPTTADADKAYYESTIGTVKTVSDLTSDAKLFDYVKSAYNIPQYVTDIQFKSSVADPKTAAKYGLTGVLAQFNFQPDGTVSDGVSAQTAEQMKDTSAKYVARYTSTAQTLGQKSNVMDAYNVTVPTFVTPVAAADDAAYYKTHIGSVTSVEQLTHDTRLFDYVKIAYNLRGLDPQASENTLRFDFETSVEDPKYAGIVGFSGVVSNFNFQSDGDVAAGGQAQTADQIAAATKSYSKNYAAEQTAVTVDAVDNYKKRIGNVKTIDDFFASNAKADDDKKNDNLPELYEMALRSYGIGENEISKSEMKKILESDPYDPKSYVSKTKDARFIALAKAFNFDSNGKLKQAVTALSTTQVNSYISEYTKDAKRGLTGAALTKATADIKTAATYFATNIAKVTTVADLLKDRKLTAFVLKAAGIDPKSVDTATLKKAFASDTDNPKSFINTPAGAQFKSMVDAFNFGTDGKLTEAKLGSAQNKGALDETNDLFLHQTLESQEGASDDGVRLALYFQRQAPSINSVYDIMADSALYSVVTTTFGLPSSISSMDVDSQAKLLKKVIDVNDLHDSTKLNKLLKRFSVEYDLKNNNGGGSSTALSILQSSHSNGVSAATMLSIAQLKSG